MDILTGKQCSRCKEWKPFSEFGKNKHSKYDGLRFQCKECRRAMQREYYIHNKEKVHAKTNQWRRENREHVRELERARYAKNPEKFRDKANKRRAKFLDKLRAKFREWRKNNPEKALEATRRWRKENIDKSRESSRNRRALKKGNGGKISKAEWQAVLDKYGHKCLYPGCTNTDLQMDHVIPLSLGGTHTANNVQPLCKFHNSSKRNKHIDYRR